MIMKSVLSVAAACLLFPLVSSAAQDIPAGWKNISPGVYEETDVNGIVTRTAMGTEGAQYDRARIGKQVRDLSDKVARNTATIGDLDAMRDLRLALENIPEKAAMSIQPKTTTSGSLCNGGFNYAFDSHFVIGLAGGSAIARVAFGIPNFGPPATVSSITQYNTAKLTPISGWGAAVTSTHSIATTGIDPSALADWHAPDIGNFGPITSTKCSGSTNAYISLSSLDCTGGTAYISQTKTYPSCVTSP
ncbi:MAG: hypothetical protein ABIN56_09295 [Dokdonella sp.]